MISPLLLVVVQAEHADRLARLPVSVDELLEDDGVALLDVDVPLVEPPSPVRGAGYRCADLAGEVIALVDGHAVAAATEGDGDGHAADAAADDAHAEVSPRGAWVGIGAHLVVEDLIGV